jgi:hypothetical protein
MTRLQAPTPPFWRKVRNISAAVAAAGLAIATLPITLPAAIVTVASYIVAIGTAVSVVSQAVTNEDVTHKPTDEQPN